jgi:hypothetical protein
MEAKKKEATPPSKFIIHRDKIIKVLEESTAYYIGFDVLSENLFRITKSNNSIELPEAVIKLIGCEKSRLRLAVSLATTRNKVSKLMGMSERNLYRYCKQHDMFPDDIIGEDGKISTKIKLVNQDTKKLKVKTLNCKPKQKLLTEGKKNKKTA